MACPTYAGAGTTAVVKLVRSERNAMDVSVVQREGSRARFVWARRITAFGERERGRQRESPLYG
jgi:hypothetical protein